MENLPSPSQLLVALIHLLNSGDEPGFGQRVQIWPEQSDGESVIVYVHRRDGDYSLRFQTETGLPSPPVASFTGKWRLDSQALNKVSDWLQLIREKTVKAEI